MKAVFLCCAELGIVDQQTRRVSAINILSNYNAKSFPVLHPKMAIVGIVQKEEGDAQQNEVILQGFFDGQEMFKSTMNLSFNLSTSLETASLLVDVNGVVVPKPGTMRFVLSAQDKTLASYDVTASPSTPQAVAHTPAPAT